MKKKKETRIFRFVCRHQLSIAEFDSFFFDKEHTKKGPFCYVNFLQKRVKSFRPPMGLTPTTSKGQKTSDQAIMEAEAPVFRKKREFYMQTRAISFTGVSGTDLVRAGCSCSGSAWHIYFFGPTLEGPPVSSPFKNTAPGE